MYGKLARIEDNEGIARDWPEEYPYWSRHAALEEMGGSSPETLFKQPATNRPISELESRLGISFPQDYKEFLIITNGFGSGDAMQDGIFNGYFPKPELWGTDKVAWPSEDWIALPFWMLKIPREIEDPYRKPSKDWDSALPLLNRVVHVGKRGIDDLWLVHPESAQKAKSAYFKMLENGDDKQKKILYRAMKDFSGSIQGFMKLEWCCVKALPGEQLPRLYSQVSHRTSSVWLVIQRRIRCHLPIDYGILINGYFSPIHMAAFAKIALDDCFRYHFLYFYGANH